MGHLPVKGGLSRDALRRINFKKNRLFQKFVPNIIGHEVLLVLLHLKVTYNTSEFLKHLYFRALICFYGFNVKVREMKPG